MADENDNVDPEVVDDQTPPTDETVDEDSKVETPEGDTPDEETSKEEEGDKPDETPEDKPDEGEDEGDDKEELNLNYNDYEDPALRQVVKTLVDSEIPVEVTNEIFGDAVESMDLTKVNRELLVEKVGEDKATQIMLMAENYMTKTYAAFDAHKKAAYELTGGQENYEAMSAWAEEKAKSDPEFAKEMAEIRALVDTGSTKAIVAGVKDLYSAYTNDPDTTVEADLLTGDKKNSDSGIKPISRLQYGQMVEKANNNGTYEQERKKLWAMRQEGIKQNI